MSRKIYVVNENLRKVQRELYPIIDVVGMTLSQLFNADWIYNNYWPRTKFMFLLRKIQKWNPAILADNPKFWDSGTKGLEMYNHAMEELSQSEGMDY